ncbi:DUF4136 domain-containing protein [Burkholderia sp. WAC0059]|uniref:DUF4136 domain-containing protein n=1 Tax=Burkholderia sp. WAC0059 TaxID=2066022 RepID=UPI000C7E8E51|nr:DUF4136 domain-containing protein [Burkholderia sp. WAC0059]PLZ01703.1 DUF4136 domain-containing protein [Burkholderia sp. WAC0059]
MKNLLTTCSLLGALLLAGCAGITTDVHTLGMQQTPQGALTWRFVSVPDDGASPSPDSAPYAALVRDGLAQRGFTEDPKGTVHYLVAVEYETHPASVHVAETGCSAAPGGCGTQASAGLSWFGKSYEHSMTLRLLALPGGDEVYRVSTARRDHDPDPQHAMPYLVAGALAQFPYAGASDWRVKFRSDGHGGTPQIVSVKPVTDGQ